MKTLFRMLRAAAITRTALTRPLLFLLLIASSACAVAQQYEGSVRGTVLDSRTLEPIPQANVVVVEKPSLGTAAGVDGTFQILGLPVGTYSLRVSALGCAPRVVTNVVISTGRSTLVTAKLDQTDIELEGVTTSAGYFNRALQMSPLSANAVDRSEILRSPGGMQDVQRVVQNLPGVASSTDNINELIVRGGAPFENLTVMDNMEIQSINHYANQFNSAGPINMVNADMIEDVQFSSGGFPARYGDKSSSVMSLTMREGNRSRSLATKTAINMAGAGTLMEGGFADGRGSYIFSLRNSLLEIIDKMMGLSTLSLTAVPKYWDTQAKIAYDLSSSQKLSFTMIYGDSRINDNGSPTATDKLRKNVIDSSSVLHASPRVRQYAGGFNLTSLFGTDGYSVLTLYGSGTSINEDIIEEFDVRPRGIDGEVLSVNRVGSRRKFTNGAAQASVGGKYEIYYKIHPQHELSAGIQYLTSAGWKNDVFVADDTSRYDLDRDGLYETGPVVVPGGTTAIRFKFGAGSKYYLFASDKVSLTPTLALTVGVRYDHYTYPGQGAFSPRASISWQIVPSQTTLSFALGKYYQAQPFPYYWDQRGIGYNRNIADMEADHYVLGFEHIFGRGLKLSVETYYKNYSHVAVSDQFVHSADKTYWSDRWLTSGKRTSYGAEIYLEQKQTEDYFGTVSLSLARTREKDMRLEPLTGSFPSDYDYPVALTLIGGKVVKGVRDWINDAPFFVKYPLSILPFSDEMEISFKYRYQTGRPYTPEEFVTWKQTREGGVKWSRGAWVAGDGHNSARYPDYSRLDLQWISRFYFQSWNINAYVAIMNVLNRKNVFFERYRTDGTVETVYQFGFFPMAGVEVEF